MTSREVLKILQDGWIQVVQLKGNDEESTAENIKAQEAYAYIIELLKQKNIEKDTRLKETVYNNFL